MNRIGLHTMVFHGHKALISTVDLFGTYETMVMYDDGEEIEVLHTYTLEEARKAHNRTVEKYNDLIYEGSIAKLLGALNYGQFVNTVKAC